MPLHSGDRRVTLVAQSSVPVDSFQLYEVPVPEEFRKAPGKKRVCVSLAFDPPVRRRRAQYLGVEMSYADPRQVGGRDRRCLPGIDRGGAGGGSSSEDHDAGGTPGSLPMRSETPAAVAQSAALHEANGRSRREQKDYGESWYLLVRATRNWAPPDVTSQDFGIAVCLEVDESRLYSLVRQRVQVRLQQRTRVRP